MTITTTTRQADGSCNSCQTMEEDAVLEVSLRTMDFRLCPDCADELAVRLRCLVWVDVSGNERRVA